RSSPPSSSDSTPCTTCNAWHAALLALRGLNSSAVGVISLIDMASCRRRQSARRQNQIGNHRPMVRADIRPDNAPPHPPLLVRQHMIDPHAMNPRELRIAPAPAGCRKSVLQLSKFTAIDRALRRQIKVACHYSWDKCL